MNRRIFLRSMAVISASGLSVGVLSRLAAETQHMTLAALLNQAEPICESLLHGSSFDSLDVPPTLNFALQELAQLIPVAKSRLADSRQFSAAFWQSCSDAFLRTSGQLAVLKTRSKLYASSLSEAQHLFEQTAQLLSSQTVVAVEMSRG